MKYIRIIRSTEKYDKRTDLWEYVDTIPDTIEQWEGKSIESIVEDVEAKFGKLDTRTKESVISYLQLVLSEYLIKGKIRTINYAKEYGYSITNGIFEDLKKLHKKIYPKANIAWKWLDGKWWEERYEFDDDGGSYHALFDFSIPIKYRKEVNDIVNKWRARYPQVKIDEDINTPSEGEPEVSSAIDVYNK